MWIILWKILWKFTSGTLRYDHCMLPPSMDQYPNQCTVQGIDQIRVDKVVLYSCADFRHLSWPILNETHHRPVIVAQACTSNFRPVLKDSKIGFIWNFWVFSEKHHGETPQQKLFNQNLITKLLMDQILFEGFREKNLESKGRWVGTSTKHWQARNNS